MSETAADAFVKLHEHRHIGLAAAVTWVSAGFLFINDNDDDDNHVSYGSGAF